MSPQLRAPRPVRAAVISSNFWPEPTGTSQTVTEFARYLAGRVAEMRVATAMPYYPQWEIWPAYRGKVWHSEVQEGMRIWRAWHYVRPRPTTAGRIAHEFTLALFSIPTMLRCLLRADVVFIASPALSYAFVAAVLARVMRVPRVVMVKDVMPDAAVELGMMTNPVMIRVSRWLARLLYRLAGEIHTLGEGMRKRIARESPLGTPIRVIPDTVDIDELAPVPGPENRFRREFVRAGTFAVLHTGNMGKKQDLDLLLRTADRLRAREDVHFFVFGDGAVKDAFLARREQLRLGNVSHHPLQERRMLRHMLSGADLVLVSQLPEVIDIVVPSKLLTALASGAMVVAACADDSEAARLIRDSGGGLVIPPSDDRALADVIERLHSKELDSQPYRERARRFAAEHFSRDAIYGPVAEWVVALGGASDGGTD